MNTSNKKLMVLTLVALVLTLVLGNAVAQPSEPPCMGCGWTPPVPDSPEYGGSLQYIFYSSGGGTSALDGWFTDKNHNTTDEFCQDGMIHFYLSTNAFSSIAWIYEWYPSGSPRGHWLVWEAYLGSPGIYHFGPFWPENREPEGEHSWEVWLYDLGTGRFSDGIFRFDFYEVCDDPDKDGIESSRDNCPNTYNPDQKDDDNDGKGDACDSCDDRDNDNVCDDRDNCPNLYNPDQKDSDNDGKGDACDSCNDRDNDNICDDRDNCPNDYNSDQADIDKDGKGNACDHIDDRLSRKLLPIFAIVGIIGLLVVFYFRKSLTTPAREPPFPRAREKQEDQPKLVETHKPRREEPKIKSKEKEEDEPRLIK
ncbi:MAG: thrombospondin type 3 repeat-containing protein [Candidatus Methanofastidiosia archaeon]